jgi:hypothetical protein
MNIIAKLLEYVIGEQYATVKLRPGGGFNITAPNFCPAGDDAQPLAGDSALAVQTERSGSFAAVGYSDASNKPKADAGEKRIYARDAEGNQVAEIWLKNTGELTILNNEMTVTLSPDGGFKAENDNGSFEIGPSGTIKIHDIEVSPSNIIDSVEQMLAQTVTAAKSLSVNSIEVHAHTHTSGGSGNPTGPMLPGTPVP